MAVPENYQVIAAAAELRDGDVGVRFEVRSPSYTSALPAFAVRYDGQICAYLNQCAHVAMEMDWQPGRFFDANDPVDARYIMCASHGAMYEPHTGLCVGGPCTGARLQSVPIIEQEGMIYAAISI